MSEYAPGRDLHRAKKSLGQNFLTDPTVCPRIAEMAQIDGIGVIEVGPGFGALTVELAKRAAKVVAVELDGDVIPKLRENLEGYPNVTVIEGDIMKMDIGQLIEEHFPGMRVAVAGNIPYNITSPLITGLLSGGYGLDSVTVMIQKEPADRFCSEPGTQDCGAVSALVWYYGIPQKLFDVGPGAFRPRPKVTSTVIRIGIRRQPAVQTKDSELFFSVVRSAFGQRRKTAANSLSSLLGESKDLIREAFVKAGLPENIRAERMTLEDFAALTDAIADLRVPEG
ncbi:MAG: ribosomal RNA small subunit methyltransferase A [Oscillospiraceae bacterium]|nr:ribosomal RNA small subunit methyltransferase A [Oscillospiraceae bacterium]